MEIAAPMKIAAPAVIQAFAVMGVGCGGKPFPTVGNHFPPWEKLATAAAFMGGVTPPLELLLLGGVDPPMGGKCYCCCRGVAI